MSDPLARLTAAIARRYAIEREIGRGGMATVYLALDRKHGRKVAVKVLDPDVAMALGPERFLREIEIAARLSHPHILPLHDSGQSAGILYYVMPYVEGESLRDRLRREQQLSLDEALRIAGDIAGALAYAHGLGVVHRDLKPENILLSGTHALLADFGIARAVAGAAGGTGGSSLTDTGLAIGTVAYMSPEQAVGSKDLDGRSDIYSLGCVLYEMLAGEPPYTGASAQAILAKRITEPPPRLRTLRETAPEWVEQAVTRALARAPADRFASASEFAQALVAAQPLAEPRARPPVAPTARPGRMLWLGIGAGALALTIAALAFLPRPGPSLDPKRVLVAVFENKTGDPALDPVAEIATDYIARGLAATRLMDDVFDARAAVHEAGKTVETGASGGRQLARKAGAGTMVWGSYYRQGDTLHFESQILDVHSGRVLLALDPVLGPATQQTAVVELLRRRVVGGFAAIFGQGFATWQAASVPPTYDAYVEMLAGDEANWGSDPESAATHYRRAAALDTGYTGAWTAAAFASALAEQCLTVDSISERLEPVHSVLPALDRAALDWATATCRGDKAAARAAGHAVLETTPRAAAGFALLESVALLEEMRPQEALAVLKQLHAESGWLTGNAAGHYHDFLRLAYHELGDYLRELQTVRDGALAPGDLTSGAELVALGALGRIDEMNRRLAVLAAMPTGVGPHLGETMECLGLELRAHGQAEASRAVLEQAAAWYRTRPPEESAAANQGVCLWHLFSVLYYTQQWAEAQTLYEKLATQDSTQAHAALGALAARRGDRAEALRFDRWLAAQGGPDETYSRARIAALLGDRDHAVDLLKQSFDKGLRGRMFIHIDPDFEPLHEYPPYQELMRLKG